MDRTTPPCPDDTRRAFLIRLARISAFVPPALVTFELSAQGPKISKPGGGKGGGGKGGGSTTTTQPAPSSIGPAAPWTVKPPGN